ncbi:MAG TPA: hypothetical protein VKQ52_19885 [Puia sp.]|nr:hypothetical protein [Puia sp.]
MRINQLTCNNTLVFLLTVCCLTGLSLPAGAQHLSAPQHLSGEALQEFAKREDSLQKFSYNIVNAEQATDRFRADSQFVRSLVRTLKMPNSFYYPFDSLQTVSHLYAPDSSFRIFTWQFKKDEYIYLQEGAIQVNQPDGSLKLFPLFDASMFTERPLDSVRTRRNWIGAIYYRIIEKTWQGRNYYTLLGFDDFSESSNKKWMEVLTFSETGEPRFGGPYFSFVQDSIHKPIQYRFNIEYKKEAGTRFNYDSALDMVVYDHLVPEGDQPQKKDTYIPDGDFEAFQWKDGRWIHVEKQLFSYKLKDGQFPMEAKMLDDQGNSNEAQLQEQSEKNLKKKPVPVKKPG